MAYTHTTFAALQTELAGRLADPDRVFWVSEELQLTIRESLRTFGLLSGFWRERGTLYSSPSLAFYDLNASLSSGSSFILAPTVADRDILLQLQYALLEKTTTQASWPGTEQFTYADLATAIQNRLNQFLSDTGIVVRRQVIDVLSPRIGRETLSEATIDVRRVAWRGAAPENYVVTLWREDERLLTAYGNDWSSNSGTPENYSIMAPPPLQIQLAPPPVTSGQLELLTVDSIALNPAVPVLFGIPDDLTPAVKWGALADLLGIDGIARDPVRAQFAEQRYQQYVQLARLLPVVIHAEINGVPLIPSTLQEVESFDPTWENSSGRPTDLILAAPNLIALNPVPDIPYSVTCDVVRSTPLPASDEATVQLGREQLDMILDYAEHLALFKVAGAEWHATERQANNFLLQSVTYNQRLSAAARAALSASIQSQRQKQGVPRRLETSVGLGALKRGR